jgi:L-ascorbate metabolism protein UlaG (beta-lactamase superfamily)
MHHIRPDIAILPIDGNGTLTVSEAAEVTRQMNPRWVIPGNWGPGSEGATAYDVERFKEAVDDAAEVIVPTLIK